MCLAVPLRIKEVRGKTAVCESNGMTRDVRVDFIGNPQPGDYVIVHAGFAIEKLTEREAAEDIEAWALVGEAVSELKQAGEKHEHRG